MQALLYGDIDNPKFDPAELGCILYLPGLPGGSTKIYDRSPYGNHGAITGATWTRLPSGLWCLNFDGTDDLISVNHNVNLIGMGSLTFEWWEKWAEYKTARVIYKNLSYYVLFWDNGHVYGRVYTDGSSAEVDSGAGDISAGDVGKWIYWQLVYDGSTVKLFKNLNEIGSGATTGNVTGTNTFYLAGGYAGQKSNSSIALFRFHNRALSMLERQNHFNREKHLFGVW